MVLINNMMLKHKKRSEIISCLVEDIRKRSPVVPFEEEGGTPAGMHIVYLVHNSAYCFRLATLVHVISDVVAARTDPQVEQDAVSILIR